MSDIEITTDAVTFTAICNADTGRPESVLYVGDDSPDNAAIEAALNERFPGYRYEILSIPGWDSTSDEIDNKPEAIAHLRETSATYYQIAHREKFEADWRDAEAYHVGDANDFATLDEAIRVSDGLDETCEWDTIVVERVRGVRLERGSKPRVVYG